MRLDPHSFADLEQARTARLEVDLTVDFDRGVLRGTATLHFHEAITGPIDLDTRDLGIDSIVDGNAVPVRFELGEPDPVLGSRLTLHCEGASRVQIRYETSEDASGLMWLEPSQTEGGEHPFMLSQCQAIHARSIVPLQDTPRMRIPYRAVLRVPSWATAVMSAAPGARSDDGSIAFDMPQPIPPYLLAVAVGVLESRDLGPRCRVFAEPEVVESAAWEFAEAERMLEEAEALFGPYQWDRYDFVVLPASFPMGGMENPRMTFLTPTLLAGDRSLVGVLAHELAHSWTGNLVTNSTNEHFWLNEGWTVWAERRILERLYGVEEATQQAILGRMALDDTIERLTAEGKRTALTYDQTGLDPDVEFSRVPYEKGFLLITALERAVGRERFDRFVARYIDAFAFGTVDTSGFIAFVDSELADHGVDFAPWLHEDGLPSTAPGFSSDRLDGVLVTARGGEVPSKAQWSTTEKLVYLARVPATVDATEVRCALGIDAHSNAELQSAWLGLAVRCGTPGLEPELTGFLNRVGRTKLLTPIYRALAGTPEGLSFARERFSANHARLHSSTRGTIEALLD